MKKDMLFFSFNHENIILFFFFANSKTATVVTRNAYLIAYYITIRHRYYL